jgi:citrate lyase subunit beta/citryl-CoA lyase
MSFPDLPGNHSSLVSHEARTCLPGCVSSRRRSWLFVPGLERAAQRRALSSGVDILVADLEEMTAPEDRQAACIRVVDFMAECRQAGVVGAVRINPLGAGGLAELEKVIEGGPDAILTAQAESAADIEALSAHIDASEVRLRLLPGRTAIVPVLNTPLAIVRTFDILSSSSRVKAAVLAAHRLGQRMSMQNPDDATALRYVRSRFALECAAVGCLAVDGAHEYADDQSLADDLAWARGAGMRSKWARHDGQVPAINRAFSRSAVQHTEEKSV